MDAQIAEKPRASKRWLAFLYNHREMIAAMDFFTVPTITFGMLYCFFVISHDREGEFGIEVMAAIRSLQISAVRTSFQSPWQNGVAERWVESCRRDLLDHVIALNESHLKRLLSEYVRYYHEDRTYLGLEKNTPNIRLRSAGRGRVTSLPRLGRVASPVRTRRVAFEKATLFCKDTTIGGRSVAVQAVRATFQVLQHAPTVLPLELHCELPLFFAWIELWRDTISPFEAL
jgi:hypothetical protein